MNPCVDTPSVFLQICSKTLFNPVPLHPWICFPGIVSGAQLQFKKDFSLSCLQQEAVVSALLAGAVVASLTGGQLGVFHDACVNRTFLCVRVCAADMRGLWYVRHETLATLNSLRSPVSQTTSAFAERNGAQCACVCAHGLCLECVVFHLAEWKPVRSRAIE